MDSKKREYDELGFLQHFNLIRFMLIVMISRFIDDLPFFFIDISCCEPINLGMLASKTNTGDMFSVCCNSVWCCWCHAPGVINTAVAEYGVTEQPVACPMYFCCGPCSTCRAHREVRLDYCKVIVACCITILRQVVHSILFFV